MPMTWGPWGRSALAPCSILPARKLHKIHLEIHKIPWYFHIKSHDISKSHQNPIQNPMKSHTKSHEIPWNPMKSHQIPWNLHKILWKSPSNLHQIPSKSHEIPSKSSRFPWTNCCFSSGRRFAGSATAESPGGRSGGVPAAAGLAAKPDRADHRSAIYPWTDEICFRGVGQPPTRFLLWTIINHL